MDNGDDDYNILLIISFEMHISLNIIKYNLCIFESKSIDFYYISLISIIMNII